MIGREKDPENSEVTRLIQRSLQIDQDRMGEQNDRAINNNQHVNENERESKSIKHLEYELTIMKECFTSMEKSLEEVEKERDHYQVWRLFEEDNDRTNDVLLETLSRDDHSIRRDSREISESYGNNTRTRRTVCKGTIVSYLTIDNI